MCEKCGTKSEVSYYSRPPFQIIENINNHDISVLYLPTTLSIGKYSFEFLCCTFHTTNHFVGLFIVENNLYVVDDLNSQELLNRIPRHKISFCYFYLRNE